MAGSCGQELCRKEEDRLRLFFLLRAGDAVEFLSLGKSANTCRGSCLLVSQYITRIIMVMFCTKRQPLSRIRKVESL